MAEKKASYSSPNLHVQGLDSQAALQFQAIRQGDGELAILLNTKKGDSLKAAATYSQLKFATGEANLENRMALDLHKQEMIERESKMYYQQQQIQEQEKQRKLKTLPAPEYVTIPSEDEERK